MRLHPAIAAACLLAACSRYEWVPDYLGPECATTSSQPPAHAGPPIRAEAAPVLRGRMISGTVVRAGSDQPIDGARVALSTEPAVGAITDSLGRFEIETVRPGRYAVAVRRIGFSTTRDSVIVPAEGGLRLAVQLEMAALDGPCSGFGLVRVRKPWWKVW